MKKTLVARLLTGVWILAIFALMISCNEFESIEPTLEEAEALAEGNDILSYANARTSNGAVVPTLWTGGSGGNATCADTGIDYELSSTRNDYDKSNGTFDDPWPAGLTVTVTGAFVSWSYVPEPGKCLDGMSVIVKGSNASNIYTYGPDVYSDSGLASPENASGGPAGLSNLTFCFTLRDCPPPVDKCWDDETAWAAGSRYVKKGNWATYASKTSLLAGVTLFAGQTLDAGSVKMTIEDGNNLITIKLKDGWRFLDDPKNVKVQGYTSAPSGNPSPGLFTTFFGQATGNTITFEVPHFKFYGVHVDLEREIECEVDIVH